MAKSSADDEELRRACEAAIEGTKQKIVMSIRVAKSHGMWGKSGKLGRGSMAKPRVLAISTKAKVKRTKAFLRVFKYSTGGVLEPAKLYKLKHLSKVEVVTNDPSGCTFMLGFDNLRSQSVAPPQWTMRNVDDRNRLLLCILNICKDLLGHLPKVVGIDVVEMALWAKENTQAITKRQGDFQDGPETYTVTEGDMQVTVEKELVSQAEEEDMEALLGTYVMGIGEAEAFSERLKRELLALEAANVHAILENEPLISEVLQGLDAATNCVEDMDEWLGIFNVKLRHMREDIESIESRNNKLEMQSVNNKSLIEELEKLLERLRIPSEYACCLTGGSFDEARMLQNIEACEWLANALQSLQVPKLDRSYANMRSVREKRAELDKLKNTFVKRASEFLRNYFASLVDFMISDKSYFSQRGQLKRPDHADLRYKCRTYARLLQHLKSLDTNCLGPLRKAYCSSLNLLLRREVTIMFVTLDKVAQTDTKYADILLLENYAAFQNSLYDLANVVPTLAKFYHQASESYEQACTRFISTIIYYQFERLFQFARRIEDLMFTIMPEEIPFQLGLSKVDLRKVAKSSLSGVDKSITAMYKKLQKNLTSEELLPSLWDKCKKEFLDKYDSFAQLVAKVYPSENIPAVSEMRDFLASM